MISVIIPTYGLPTGLLSAIRSVLSQTCHDLELIVVDDNNPSTEAREQTETILSSISDSRIKYIRHPKNLNGANARNTGIKAAHGEYVAFLDSDDEYLPTRLEKCLAALSMADECFAGVYSGCEFRRGGRTYHVVKSVPSGNFLVQTLATNFMFCTGSNLFVRRKVVDELNGFDGSFLRHQDYEFLVRIFERYSLIGLDEPLVIKNNENVNVPNIQKQIDIKKQYLEKFNYLLKTLSQEDYNYVFHTNCIGIAELAQRSGEKEIAAEYYKKASGYKPLSLIEKMRRIAFSLNLSRI